LVRVKFGLHGAEAAEKNAPVTCRLKLNSRFFPVTFLGFLSGPFRGENVTSIWVIKRSLGRSWFINISLHSD